MKGTWTWLQLEECGDLDMELHCILMGNRVELFVGFAPSSQSKGFSAPFKSGLSMDENCAWRCDWLDGLSSENDHISTPWCTVSDLVVVFAGCFFHMPVVIGCEKHELNELSCFLPCPENNLRTETPRIRESFQGNIHKTSLYLGEKTITIFPVKNLVGGLEHFFFHILGMSSSQLTPSFCRGVGSTSNQIIINHNQPYNNH